MARHKRPFYDREPRALIAMPITGDEKKILRQLAAEWRLPGIGYVLTRMMREYFEYLRRGQEPESYLLQGGTTPPDARYQHTPVRRPAGR